MDDKRNDEIEIDLQELFLVILNKFLVIFLTGVILGLVGFILSKFVLTPQYESITKIYVLSKQNETNITYSDLQMGSQLTKDYKELIISRPVLENVIVEQGLELEYAQLKNKIDVTIPNDTRIITITVTDASPYEAMNIANSIREYSADQIAKVMDIKAVNVVEEASLPSKPASPNIIKNTLIGILIGIVFAIALIVVRFVMDDTIKNQEDIETRLGISTLAIIPLQNVKSSKSRKKRKK